MHHLFGTTETHLQKKSFVSKYQSQKYHSNDLYGLVVLPQFRQTINILMYNLEELNRKEKEELLNIASELGIKNAEKMDDLTLRLTIIDEQATNFASTAASNEKTGRKRS